MNQYTNSSICDGLVELQIFNSLKNELD